MNIFYNLRIDIQDIVDYLSERTESDGRINHIFLWESTSIIGRVGSIVLGLLTLIVLIMVPIIMSIEVAYIAFPPLREKIDELMVKLEDNKGARNVALGFMLRDAVEAVKQANIDRVGERSAMWIYIGIKVKSMMFVAFIVAIVLRGSSSIFNFIYRIIYGILEAFPDFFRHSS